MTDPLTALAIILLTVLAILAVVLIVAIIATSESESDIEQRDRIRREQNDRHPHPDRRWEG